MNSFEIFLFGTVLSDTMMLFMCLVAVTFVSSVICWHEFRKQPIGSFANDMGMATAGLTAILTGLGLIYFTVHRITHG